MENFDFGMNIHNFAIQSDYFHGYNEEYFRLIKEMGMTCVRFSGILESPEVTERFDRAIDLCGKYGLNVMFVLGNLLADGVPGRPKWTTMDEYREHAEFVSSRYRGRVKYYQLLNETPDWAMKSDEGGINRLRIDGKHADGLLLGDYNMRRLDFAAQRIRAYAEGVKAGDPAAKRVVNFCWWHVAGMEYFVEQGCDFNVAGMDWYSPAEDNCSAVMVMDYMLSKYPDKEIIICECNRAMNNDDTEKEQADWCEMFAKKIYGLDRPRVLGVIFYELVDQKRYERSQGSYNQESHFGFIKTDETGKPVYKKQAFHRLKDYITSLK